jgi:GINS complex subunit 3
MYGKMSSLGVVVDANVQLKENTKLELALWLAELLAISGITPDSNKSFLSLLQPTMFSNKVVNALKTDAVNVDLHAQSSVFFAMAERWLSLFGDHDLTEVMVETVQRRSAEISDFAHTPRGTAGDSGDFLLKLESFERKRMYTYIWRNAYLTCSIQNCS